MTRDEARRIEPDVQANLVIDLLQQLGVVRLDEPKSADDELRQIITRHASDRQAQCILNALDNSRIIGVERPAANAR